MSPFRRVEPSHAGPSALAILVPPGARTLVILRPRSLDWDLLPARWSGDPSTPPEFCQFERDEAARLARRLLDDLEAAVVAGRNPVETLGDADGRSFQIWVRAADHFWIPCRRVERKGYQPLVFVAKDDAQRAGEALARFVWPAAGAEQEYYINTQRFA